MKATMKYMIRNNSTGESLVVCNNADEIRRAYATRLVARMGWQEVRDYADYEWSDFELNGRVVEPSKVLRPGVLTDAVIQRIDDILIQDVDLVDGLILPGWSYTGSKYLGIECADSQDILTFVETEDGAAIFPFHELVDHLDSSRGLDEKLNWYTVRYTGDTFTQLEAVPMETYTVKVVAMSDPPVILSHTRHRSEEEVKTFIKQAEDLGGARIVSPFEDEDERTVWLAVPRDTAWRRGRRALNTRMRYTIGE